VNAADGTANLSRFDFQGDRVIALDLRTAAVHPLLGLACQGLAAPKATAPPRYQVAAFMLFEVASQTTNLHDLQASFLVHTPI
jgi:hypothetical protein